ncbi:MAG: hypothetical protein L0215_24600 [Gemmataceae bacterium]|nr:hypothetical protein [Gemmataceae bacterium]
MNRQEFEETKAWLDKQLEEMGSKDVSLNDIVGENYARELARMTEREAIEHLRSLDGEQLLHAYLVLATRPAYPLRACHPVLAEPCLKLMASSNRSDRILGAGDIGLWLEGTRDKQASRALASIVRDPQESDVVRHYAYLSLQLINNKASILECSRRHRSPGQLPRFINQEIDWDLVDSFL